MLRRPGVNIFYVLIFTIGLFAGKASGQGTHIVFKHLYEQPELSQNHIFDIKQDKKGYLWFATYNGLFRFDGFNIKKYNNIPGDSNSIPSGPVHCLVFDKWGDIWVSIIGNGLARLSHQSGTFTHYLSNPEDEYSLSGNHVISMDVDWEGNIWAATEKDGLNKITIKPYFTVERFSARNNNLSSNYVTKVYCDATAKKLYAGIGRLGLFVYNKKGNRFINIPTFTLGPDSSSISDILVDHKTEQIIINASCRFGKYDLKNRSYHSYWEYWEYAGKKHHQNSIGDGPLLLASNGDIWWGTNDSGLICIKPNGTKTVYQHLHTEPNSIRSNTITALLEDGSGNLWVGTPDGLDKINKGARHFKLVTLLHQNGNSSKVMEARSLYAGQKGLYIGTKGAGISHIAPNGEKTTFLIHDPTLSHRDNIVNCIYENREGNLWLGTEYGVALFDPGSKKFINQMNLYSEDVNWQNTVMAVWSIFEDDRRNLWFGTRGRGLIKYDPHTGVKETYLKIAGPDNAKSNSIWCIFEDSEKRIWLGTDNGLVEMRMQDNNPLFISYSDSTTKGEKYQGENIWYIYEDPENNLWLSSTDKGLYKFNKETLKFKLYTTTSGLTTNIVSGIIADKNNRLWISTTSGLCLFNPQTEKVERIFTAADGLQSDHFNFRCCDKSVDGTMYFGGSKGVTYFNPDEIKKNDYNAPVVVTSFRLMYDVHTDELKNDTSIVLPYDKGTFSFEFAALDYTNPSRNEYRFMLTGFDKDWVYVGERRYASYTNLDPGNYTFLLKATNSDGVWSKQMVRINIKILPAFYQKWWFIALVVLSVVILVTFIIYIVIKRKEDKRKRIVSELATLRTQLNPHFIFNSLNSIQHFINTNERKIANSYLSRFSALMRMILENSDKAYITLSEEVRFLNLYLDIEAMRFNYRIQPMIETDISIDPEVTLIPPMLIQPLVENAIKHGLVAIKDGGKVKVTFKRSGSDLLCIVEDNGIGRQKSQELKEEGVILHASMATKIIMERLDILNKNTSQKSSIIIIDLYDRSGKAIGTRVEISFPLKTIKEHQPTADIFS